MTAFPPPNVSRLRWPLPAVLAWGLGWATWTIAGAVGPPSWWAFCAAAGASAAVALSVTGPWRRAIAGGGFPLSAWLVGAAADMPPWLWLLLLLAVLAAYPLRAWRDAPFFPTPRLALHGLDAVVGTPQRVLDAGCGLGHGLAALRRLWPGAELQGLEWSAPLAWAAAWRCRGLRAQVRRGDMWTASWAGHDLVYLFQRPESMARAFAKASRELAPGAWLVSLEFAVPGQEPWACLRGEGDERRRPVWVYRPAAADRHAAPRSTGASRSR